MDSITI